MGEPTWESVRQPIGRLIMTSDQHPSTLKKDDVLILKLQFDGEPIINQSVVLTHSGQKERVGDKGETYRSNHEGIVSISLPNTGTHLVMTRLQANAPEGAETDIRSYTTALTFNVTNA